MSRYAVQDGCRRLAWAVGFTVVVTGRLAGANVGVVPTKLIVVDKGASGAKAVFVTKDAAIDKGPGTDPYAIGAQLFLTYDNGTDPAIGGTFFAQPVYYSGAPATWVAFNATVAKYVNKDAPNALGDTKVVVIKPGKLAKLVGKGLGDDDLEIPTQGGAASGIAHAAFCVIDLVVPFGECFCSELPGCTWKAVAGGTGAKVVCRGGTGDVGCNALAQPTTTTTTTVVTSTTSTTDPPRPVCCTVVSMVGISLCDWRGTAAECFSAGGTPGPAGSICQPTGVCAAPPVLSGECCANIPGNGGVCASIVAPSPSVICTAGGGTPVANAVCLPDGSCAAPTDVRCCDGYSGDQFGDVCDPEVGTVATCLNGLGGSSSFGLPGAPGTSCSGGGDCLPTPTPGTCCSEVFGDCIQTGESCAAGAQTTPNAICDGSTCVTQ